ncbi:Calcium-transporting ATPase 8 [Abeliophyllum distichum]|uniref:Calcium-transporting ATPase 8 n=1 Tax=Abeliophyllum distichum TaxID=126358 RepID=A0ABD1V7S7_9LAMI
MEVIRGGRRINVSIFDIVVGDVVPLKIVPADGILVTGHSLAIDDSSMTGESKVVHKDPKSPFLMSGCKVADGNKRWGKHGWGLLMASISEDNGEETPLQVRLIGVATFIGVVGLAVAVVVLIVLVIRFFTGHTKNPDGRVQFQAGKTGVGDAIDGFIKIFTVAVPEGLPLAFTLTSGGYQPVKPWALQLNQLGMDFDAVRSMSLIIHAFPFNSEKKRGGVALKLSNSEVVHWKGAAEMVLASCTNYMDANGCVTQMEEDKVRMVTGDNLQMAKAIALECGILRSNGDATEPNLIEGKAFRAMSETQRLEVADKISVMGRSSPNDKLLLVQALRKKGHVVAVTGDGTNDARALHEVCSSTDHHFWHWIGLEKRLILVLQWVCQGTEVAKESSDIIILDDNFASVVKVMRWGRSVYANIQKFIQFQLTVNVAVLIINIVAAVSAGNVPLNAVQLLWVNLIMDTL